MEVPNSLIGDHLNGELSADGFVELSEWLRTRESHMREFAVQWMIHSSLHDLMSQWEFRADALLRAMTSSGDLPAAPLPADRSERTSEFAASDIDIIAPGKPIKVRAGYWRLALIGLAALLLIGVTAATWSYLAKRPRVVAMLTQTANCQWEQSEKRLFDGALLKTGDVLRLREGRELVNFPSGA